MDQFFGKLLEVINDNPKNVSVEVDQTIWPIFKEQCSPAHLRQRAFIMILLANGIKHDSETDHINRLIMENILSAVGRVLDARTDEYMNELATTSFTCYKMAVSMIRKINIVL